MRITAAAAALLGLAWALVSASPGQTPQVEHVDRAAIARITAEALQRSHVMETAEYLTDAIGGRLTGSANLRRAQTYVRERLESWGLANVHLEPWGPFGRAWELDDIAVAMTAPSASPLIAYAKAWSPGTRGTIEGEPIWLDAMASADLDKYRGRLAGRIVLFSPARAVPALPAPAPVRLDAAALRVLADKPASAGGAPVFQPTPAQRAAAELNALKWRLVYDEGPAVVLEPGGGANGRVYVTAAVMPAPSGTQTTTHPWDMSKPAVVPQVVIAAEQYNRLVRLRAGEIPVRLRVRVDAHYDDADPMSANVIGEIPGADLRDEVVMFGGCLDSWHTGTGATDNAAGAAVALEAMRVLRALDVHPRRTIRIGLWSAEEQGTLGSRAYVAAHFGRIVTAADGARRLERGPDYDRLAGYFNLDYGTGRIRGVYLQGNEAVRPIFRAWLAPLEPLGASTLTLAGIGATDHVPFAAIGLPAFQFLRDFMEGSGSDPSHTNMDVYDHLLESDLEQAAAVVASFAYDLAMRNDKLPRNLPAGLRRP